VNAVEAPIRVVVAGPDGVMGRTMVDGLPRERGIDVVGTIRRRDDPATVRETLAGAHVLVEFTHVDSSPDLMRRAIDAGVRPVSGTSGVAEDVLAEVDRGARERGIGAVWAANYRLMGVLLAHFARIAARYADTIEIIDSHHASKADAPSGTARELARLMREAHGTELVDPPVKRETLSGVRGGVMDGVRIHSLRLPGLEPNGWHEIVFAGDQEILTLRHDDWSRTAYVGPVARAIRKVMEPGVVGLLRGYDSVLGLSSDSDGGQA
jgi:4-hydroxy-tetrahydrodipicolinate reductase